MTRRSSSPAPAPKQASRREGCGPKWHDHGVDRGKKALGWAGKRLRREERG